VDVFESTSRVLVGLFKTTSERLKCKLLSLGSLDYDVLFTSYHAIVVELFIKHDALFQNSKDVSLMGCLLASKCGLDVVENLNVRVQSVLDRYELTFGKSVLLDVKDLE